LSPHSTCYHCEYRLSGRHNICTNIRFLLTPHHPGFFREFVNLPVSNFVLIPSTVSFDLPLSPSRRKKQKRQVGVARATWRGARVGGFIDRGRKHRWGDFHGHSPQWSSAWQSNRRSAGKERAEQVCSIGLQLAAHFSVHYSLSC
jgi:hypothetical protein